MIATSRKFSVSGEHFSVRERVWTFCSQLIFVSGVKIHKKLHTKEFKTRIILRFVSETLRFFSSKVDSLEKESEIFLQNLSKSNDPKKYYESINSIKKYINSYYFTLQRKNFLANDDIRRMAKSVYSKINTIENELYIGVFEPEYVPIDEETRDLIQSINFSTLNEYAT